MSYLQASPDAANGIRSVPSQHLSSHPSHVLPQLPQAAYPAQSQHRQAQSSPMYARPHQSSQPQQPSYPRQAASYLSKMPRPARPLARDEASIRRRSRKVIGDGFESSYFHVSASNRLVLSLKSGLPSQVDWALARLAQHSGAHRDVSLDTLTGLADILLSYVRRLCDAVAGKPETNWHPHYFDQNEVAADVGTGAPGEIGFQGASTWYSKAASRSHQHEAVDDFQPSQIPAHADLLRRGLESALILRNLAMQTSNARHLASVKGFYTLICDVLTLPVSCLDRATAPEDAADADAPIDELGELRLYFLDILEGLAHKFVVSYRSEWPTNSTTRLQEVRAGNSPAAETASDGPGLATSSDKVFSLLLQIVHTSQDRALLLGSLRCLSAMAAIDKNEMAFVELEQTDGSSSPGLLARCTELLPVTNDLELLEAVLDLLYQLVCISNNGLRLTAANFNRRGAACSKTVDAQDDDVASGAFAKAAALVRLLTRNLQIGRTIWERDHKLYLHRDWTQSVPSRMRETIRKERELRVKLANETAEERAQKKRLRPMERQRLLELPEPERGIAWMKTVFKGSPSKEVTQMEFWTTYKEEFGSEPGIALQPAADLIRTVSQIFPGAAAMVIQGVNGSPNRFIIRGIEVNEREQLDPYRCLWQSCPAPATKSDKAQQSHAKLHARFASDGTCRWLNCRFQVSNNGTNEATIDILMSHVLTHLPSVKVATSPVPDDDQPAKTVPDEDSQHEAAEAEHTGLPPDFEKSLHPNGTRYISGKRTADGERVQFDLSPREAVNGHDKRSAGTGTIDNPGMLTFEVVRTPSAGADEWPSPQGPAYVSMLILRMLTRNAAHLLRKAGSTQPNSEQEDANAAAMRGEGEDKFGLPIPANFSGENKAEQEPNADGEAEGPGLPGETQLANAESWAVKSAARFMDAVAGVEDELVLHSSQNDILARYINETLVELRDHSEADLADAIDPIVAMSNE